MFIIFLKTIVYQFPPVQQRSYGPLV